MDQFPELILSSWSTLNRHRDRFTVDTRPTPDPYLNRHLIDSELIVGRVWIDSFAWIGQTMTCLWKSVNSWPTVDQDVWLSIDWDAYQVSDHQSRYTSIKCSSRGDQRFQLTLDWGCLIITCTTHDPNQSGTTTGSSLWSHLCDLSRKCSLLNLRDLDCFKWQMFILILL